MPEADDFLDKNALLLTLTSYTAVTDFNLNLLKYYANQKDYGCVYVSINRPYRSIISELGSRSIKIENVYIIDMVSKIEKMQEVNERVLFISAPTSLTETSIAIESALASIKNNRKIVIFESTSTMSLYNGEKKMISFFHFLINRLRDYDSKLAIISTKDRSSDFVKQLVQFCDMHLEINDDISIPWINQKV
ncbi:MAG TPA: hypothetical protein VI894_00645 [Candidatus Nanoarchaeia archaeon]|nr:hypothetical protein [Candidatus Nanoarchaeia archaeon]